VFTNFTAAIINAVSPTAHSAKTAKEDIGFCSSRLKDNVTALKKDRSIAPAELETDFTGVLKAWGMSEADIPRVVREMYMRLIVYAGLFVIALLLALQAFYFPALAVFLCAFLGSLVTVWRICVLSERTFFAFPGHSLLAFLLIKKGGKGGSNYR
jgi:hypothetical protein